MPRIADGDIWLAELLLRRQKSPRFGLAVIANEFHIRPMLGTGLQVASRVGAAVFGSYAFVWGFIMLVAVLGTASGMSFGDARALGYLLAFLVFLICFCWAFAARNVVRVWLVLVTGAAVMSGLGWFASSMMV